MALATDTSSVRGPFEFPDFKVGGVVAVKQLGESCSPADGRSQCAAAVVEKPWEMCWENMPGVTDTSLESSTGLLKPSWFGGSINLIQTVNPSQPTERTNSTLKKTFQDLMCCLRGGASEHEESCYRLAAACLFPHKCDIKAQI